MVDSDETMVFSLYFSSVPQFLQVIDFDFSRERLSVASSQQHLLSKACYKNIE
ncbi:hypothetical protein CK203_018545 [Vitis vinifera]|uniref:Uncharacterized protein n=1 Tax=Vitis vinifera TaxID=29760 RepID=A0A438J6A2_VITVI|nr:hypothetical protein CK203_018545 [Vitis vinifera]